ncbi:hypothetical protein BD779DRAFT_1621917 [Infundibulicybe gibba]|nr:hypothetical protein BD779DRAFT_1621917 [Infundibulicybe gibba]
MAYVDDDNVNQIALQRDQDYYISGADLHLLVENTHFRIHRFFFERESPKFKEWLSAPSAPGQPLPGSTDSTALALEDVCVSEMKRFLWVFYIPTYNLYECTVGDWKVILRLAHQWEFAEVKALALRHIESLPMLPVARILLYIEYQVDPALLVPLYAELCSRAEPLTDSEAEQLGLQTTLHIFRTRERLRANPSNSGTSPLPAEVDAAQVQSIVRTSFFDTAPRSPTTATGRPDIPEMLSNIRRGAPQRAPTRNFSGRTRPRRVPGTINESG